MSNPTEDTPISENQHSDTQTTNVYQNKQDDTQLREAIEDIFDEYRATLKSGTGQGNFSDGGAIAEENAKQQLLALFQKEQIQLVTELRESLPKKQKITKDERNDGYGTSTYYKNGRNIAIDQVRTLLEHKKQELEGGK